MTIYQVQHIFHNVDGLPENDFVNTLHFHKAGLLPDTTTAAAIAGYVAAAHYDAQAVNEKKLEAFYGPQISRSILPTLKVYDAIGTGSPLAVATQAAVRAADSTTGLPNEVAMCLSFRGDYGTLTEEAADDGDLGSEPERPRSRVRGRIFLGPFGQGANFGAVPVPHSELQQAALDFADRLYGIGASVTGASWVIFSKENGTETPVTTAWVDNAFDTQRRRGQKATARTTVTLS